MGWFTNLPIRKRLIVSFIAVALIAGAIGTVGVLNLKKLGKADAMMFETCVAPMPQLMNIQQCYLRVRVNLREAIMATTPQEAETFRTVITQIGSEATAAENEFERSIASDEMRRAFGKYQDAKRSYDEIQRQIVSLAVDQRDDEALALTRGRGKEIAASVQSAMDEVVGIKIAHGKAVSEGNTRAANRAMTFMVLILAGGMAGAILLGLVVGTMIGTPLRDLSKKAQQVATGDVDVEIDTTGKDEVAEVARSFAAVVSNIREQALVAQKIASGDMTVDVKTRSEKDVLGKSMAHVVTILRDLVTEATALARAGVEGRLSTRGNTTKFQGGYREIVQGVNDTLDAVIKPVEEAAQVLEQVAERDMRARVIGSYQGDHARIKESLNRAVDNLDKGLQQVGVAVEQVASASSQIGTGSQTLAQGTNEQASALQEVSSSLQEMASMTGQNAANAKDARGMAEAARASATKGLEGMTRLSDAVGKIKSSSDATAKIVKTIDEIAFQTNLLALNAAVEAARAGDAGKGFAVVAEEVRNLAMRSAEAAKNTANMIEESVQNAENGVSLNAAVLEQLQEIVTQSNRVTEVMSEIAAGSDQQKQGIEQITTSVDSMNQVTQSNAANSEESASAAEELSGQAEELRGLVALYQLSATVDSGRRRRPAPAHQSLGASPPARSNMKLVKAAKKGASPDPESVIPFHDDEDLAAMGGF
jgi:methyl-accepting chemotaxis protein